ncbi:MAG TPA: ABC transporter ATP-binding protein [Thermoanaerobaculia bacterium]|nr:ABC transporter ATP-binding protein [Thermoanaerobaculia bacterium]
MLTHSTDPPTLSARNLTKIIGKRTIVEDVSFDVYAGEVFGFLGPNGAGKTTTIRMLVGLISPTSGSVAICGLDSRREFEKAMRCIGCIVETPDLYRFMTGRENLEHFARMIGGVDDGQIERVAALVALEHRLDDRVRTYSLGMRQRLGIAQSLLGKPRLLILDEPANGLDPAGIREIRELLRGLAENEGMSVLISSHLLAEIELMCDRVAIIHKGKLLKIGSVAEMTQRAHELELRVDDPQKAMAVSAASGFPMSLQDGALMTPADERVPDLIALLASSGVRVYEAKPRVQTLEESFLAVTGGETVG